MKIFQIYQSKYEASKMLNLLNCVSQENVIHVKFRKKKCVSYQRLNKTAFRQDKYKN